MNRVDHHQVRPFLFDQAADLVHIVFGGQIDIVLGNVQTGSPKFYLADRFLAGDIENRIPVRNSPAELEQHGGFAYTRLAAQQYNSPQNNTAAQHTVKLSDAGDDSAFLFGGTDFGQTFGGQCRDAFLTRCSFCSIAAGFGSLSDDIFAHGVPASAAGAASHPAGACLAAVGADVDGF